MKEIKLTKGQTLKNYKELCTVMDWKVYSGGNGKVAQFKELDRICKWHKEGQKIIIDEVFNYCKKKIENRGKKSMNYIENIETIIIGEMVTNGKDNRLAIGKSVLLRESGLVNTNFSYSKKRPLKVAKALECDLNTVSEYFNLNNKSLITDMEKALKSLRAMRLIQFNTVQMICKINTDIINYNHSIVTDEFEEEIDIFNPNFIHTYSYEVATDKEREIILSAEKKILSEMKCSKINTVFATNRTKEYFKKVYELVRKDIPNFNFYYSGYDIIFNYDFVVEELNNRGYTDWLIEDKQKQQQIVNDGAMKKITNNTVVRQNKAISDGSTDKTKHRTTLKYIEDTKILNNKLIDIKAENIKSNIKKTLIKEEDLKGYQISFKCAIDSDDDNNSIPF